VAYERSDQPSGSSWAIRREAAVVETGAIDAWAFTIDALAMAITTNPGPRFSMLRWRRDRRDRSGADAA
jgi:hypothetical protein